jgi:hypothetical protein
LLAALGNHYELFATSGKSYQLFATFGKSYELFATFGKVTSCLPHCGTSYQLFATFGNSYQFFVTFGNSYQLFAKSLPRVLRPPADEAAKLSEAATAACPKHGNGVKRNSGIKQGNNRSFRPVFIINRISIDCPFNTLSSPSPKIPWHFQRKFLSQLTTQIKFVSPHHSETKRRTPKENIVINPILHMWFRDSCFTLDGSSIIQGFPCFLT